MAKKIITVPVLVPEELYDDLEQRTGGGQRRVGAWILKRIQSAAKPTPGPKRRPVTSPLEKWYGVFHGGRHGSNNRKIDEDIAREIAGESRNGKRR